MKARLEELLKLEQLTPSRFADLIGVQRSSVSHVLSGRNKPSFDFLEKTLRAFPGLRADWLILGKGELFEQGKGIQDLFSDGQDENPPDQGRKEQEPEPEAALPTGDTDQEIPGQDSDAPGLPEADVKLPGNDRRKPVRVLVLYDDHTFDSYHPPI